MTISATNQGLRPGVCTSTSRPSTPFDGQVIYETDTDRVMSWDGSAWLFVAVPQSTNPASWTSFTPTWTNLTVGNATQSFVYREENKTMFVSGKITFGSTTSISNNPSIAIPNGRTGSDTVLGSTLRFEDAGNSNFFGQLLVSATNIDLYAITVSSTYPTLATLGSTAPFTWGTNDAIYIACSFRIL